MSFHRGSNNCARTLLITLYSTCRLTYCPHWFHSLLRKSGIKIPAALREKKRHMWRLYSSIRGEITRIWNQWWDQQIDDDTCPCTLLSHRGVLLYLLTNIFTNSNTSTNTNTYKYKIGTNDETSRLPMTPVSQSDSLYLSCRNKRIVHPNTTKKSFLPPKENYFVAFKTIFVSLRTGRKFWKLRTGRKICPTQWGCWSRPPARRSPCQGTWTNQN